MKLACNDSPPLRLLLDRNCVTLDFLKVGRLDGLREDVDAALAYRSALIHVEFGIGDTFTTYTDFDWRGFNALVKRSGSPHVAMHLPCTWRRLLITGVVRIYGFKAALKSSK